MDELIQHIKKSHRAKAPSKKIEVLLENFKLRYGREIPEELAYFYQCCGSAELYGSYRILPLEEIRSANMAIFGEELSCCSPDWFVFLDAQDSNYIGFDISPNSQFPLAIIDLNHENAGRPRVIASSLEEFLELFLFPSPYWLNASFAPLTTLSYNPPPDFYRKLDGKCYQDLVAEVGPENCTTSGCMRKHIAGSVKCKRHHYEMIQKRECPFPE